MQPTRRVFVHGHKTRTVARWQQASRDTSVLEGRSHSLHAELQGDGVNQRDQGVGRQVTSQGCGTLFVVVSRPGREARGRFITPVSSAPRPNCARAQKCGGVYGLRRRKGCRSVAPQCGVCLCQLGFVQNARPGPARGTRIRHRHVHAAGDACCSAEPPAASTLPAATPKATCNAPR